MTVWFSILLVCAEVLIMGYCYDMIARFGKFKPWQWIVPTIFFQLIIVLFWDNDLALIWANKYDGGATLPYSRLWFVLNPFWNTTKLYLAYLFAWQMCFLGFMYLCTKLPIGEQKWFSIRYVYWTQISNMMLLMIHNGQSIVPMSFLYLTPISIWGLIMAAALKFPIGWNLDSPHVQCFLGKIDPQYGSYVTPCGHLFTDYPPNPTLIYNWFVYVFIVIWAIRVLLIWYKHPQRSWHKNEI